MPVTFRISTCISCFEASKNLRHPQVFVVLHRDCFGTFASAKPRTGSKLARKNFSQTFGFSSSTALSPIAARTFSVSTSGKRNKLVALLSNHYTEKELVSLCAPFEHQHLHHAGAWLGCLLCAESWAHFLC